MSWIDWRATEVALLNTHGEKTFKAKRPTHTTLETIESNKKSKLRNPIVSHVFVMIVFLLLLFLTALLIETAEGNGYGRVIMANTLECL